MANNWVAGVSDSYRDVRNRPMPSKKSARQPDHTMGTRTRARSRAGSYQDAAAQAMRVRRETVEQPFGTLKMRMGATHFLMKTLPRVATEMALACIGLQSHARHDILGIQPLLAAMRA
jgi:hypothetical protein